MLPVPNDVPRGFLVRLRLEETGAAGTGFPAMVGREASTATSREAGKASADNGEGRECEENEEPGPQLTFEMGPSSYIMK